MAENTNTSTGRLLLAEKDFVKVVDAEGEDLPPVPKHWTAEDLPAGAEKKSTRSSSSTSSSSSSSSTTARQPGTEPKGNASTEEWTAYAREKGATDADLLDEDGKPLGQAALRTKYGTAQA